MRLLSFRLEFLANDGRRALEHLGNVEPKLPLIFHLSRFSLPKMRLPIKARSHPKIIFLPFLFQLLPMPIAPARNREFQPVIRWPLDVSRSEAVRRLRHRERDSKDGERGTGNKLGTLVNAFRLCKGPGNGRNTGGTGRAFVFGFGCSAHKASARARASARSAIFVSP